MFVHTYTQVLHFCPCTLAAFVNAEETWPNHTSEGEETMTFQSWRVVWSLFVYALQYVHNSVHTFACMHAHAHTLSYFKFCILLRVMYYSKIIAKEKTVCSCVNIQECMQGKGKQKGGMWASKGVQLKGNEWEQGCVVVREWQ